MKKLLIVLLPLLVLTGCGSKEEDDGKKFAHTKTL